jgi:hypothetical protein
MVKTQSDWKQTFNSKVNSTCAVASGRKAYETKDYLVYLNDIVTGWSGVSSDDIILDAGGGVGLISLALSSFVKCM